MRRSRGEGSVYKRKDGLWVAHYEAAGKRKYLYGKTKKIVTDRLRERMSARGNPGGSPDGRLQSLPWADRRPSSC